VTTFLDRFDLDVILNVAAGVILGGIVLGALYLAFTLVMWLIAES